MAEAFLPDAACDGLHALANSIDDATLAVAIVMVRTSGVSTRVWCDNSNTGLLQLRGAVAVLADEARALYCGEDVAEERG